MRMSKETPHGGDVGSEGLGAMWGSGESLADDKQCKGPEGGVRQQTEEEGGVAPVGNETTVGL